MTLDAGGTNFVFGAIRGCEEVVEPIHLPSAANNLELSLANLINGFHAVRSRLKEPPVAISFAFPGPADYPNGIIWNIGNLPAYKGGVAVGPMLAAEFGIPVFINNDGDLYAYGEAISGYLPWVNAQLEKAGSPKRYHNLVGLTLGTGFGGGIVRNGNLFLGEFDLLNALIDALKSTKFGMQFESVPTQLSGYYKYTPGETFYELDKSAPDKLRPVPDRTDQPNIYAIFYESTDERPILDATDALAEDNPQVISTAIVDQDDVRPTTEWTYFEIPFVYRPGKSVDPDKLAAGRYCLAIIFASSIRGDYFEGAPGSTLCIDEVELSYEETVNE